MRVRVRVRVRVRLVEHRLVLEAPYISPISRLYLPFISPISPLHLAYISPTSHLVLEGLVRAHRLVRGRVRVRVRGKG